MRTTTTFGPQLRSSLIIAVDSKERGAPVLAGFTLPESRIAGYTICRVLYIVVESYMSSIRIGTRTLTRQARLARLANLVPMLSRFVRH